MSPEPKLQETYLADKNALTAANKKQELLFYIKKQLDDIIIPTQESYYKKLDKITAQLAKVLDTKDWVSTSDAPLLKAIVRKEIQRLSTKKTQLCKKIADYQEHFVEPIDELTQNQITEREKNSPFTYKPLRSYFPERRQASINWNNPYDLIQATYGDEKEYNYLAREPLQEMSKEMGWDIDQLQQEATKYIPLDIEKIPLETWHKLGKYNKANTSKQLLTTTSIAQLSKDISYFKEVIRTTHPLERLNKRATRRVQMCTHPDHAWKIFVYRTVTTPNSDGKKTPHTQKFLSIYSNIISFLRSQHHTTQWAQKDLELRDNLLHTLHTIRINIKDKNSLPTPEVLDHITTILEDRKNHHLVTILDRSITKLRKETHPERARNILRWAENELLKRIGDQEEIKNTVQTQKQQLNRVHDLVDLVWRRTGRDIKEHLRNDRNKRDISYVHKLLTAYKKNSPDQTFNPYKKFIDEIDTLMSGSDLWSRDNKKTTTLLMNLDILLSIHALQYVVLDRYDRMRKSRKHFPAFPCKKRISGTKGVLKEKYWSLAEDKFIQLEKYVEEIDLLINVPLESESNMIESESYSDENLWDTTPQFLPLNQKNEAIKKLVDKIVTYNWLKNM